MKPNEFFVAIKQIIDEKGIAKDIIYSAIQQALITAYRKKLGSSKDLKVVIDEEKKDIKVYWCRMITEDGILQRNGITISEARKIKADAEINETLEVEIPPEDIGRIAAQTVKQVVMQKFKEAEREIQFEEYMKKKGILVTGNVQKIEKKKVLISLGKLEATLPEKEQIGREIFKVGNPVKVCVSEVRKDAKGLEIIVTRASSDFLEGLFRYYIPEINEGIVKIKASVREAGSRSKISVACSDKKIDPIGACVGLKGSRIKEIVSELMGEKIDIIRWDEDASVYCSNALSPAKVISVNPIEGGKGFLVVVPDTQLSLAIGKDGQNVRLAAQLTKYKIDIKSESQYKEHLNKVMDGTASMGTAAAVENSGTETRNDKETNNNSENENL
ncbi:MAG TPA: transcription termination factor NusA [Candidatus Wallbacteria bacterium]|nr:transcription termination factor NusA [Candidatus Wallbacteria bacterium]